MMIIIQSILFIAAVILLGMWCAPFVTEQVKRQDVKGFFVYGIIASALWVATLFNPFYIVDGGHRGIVKQFGAIQAQELGEGLNIINPFTQSVDQWDVRVFKSQVKSDSVSKDLQTITTESALNYHVDPTMAAELKQKVGANFADVIIAPVIQESLKAATAQYPIQELTANRAMVRDQAKQLIVAKLAPYYIKVDDYSIINFAFSKKFEQSIETKQVAEQAAEQAKFELEKVKTDAQQQIARAQAEAEGLKAQREQITPELLKLRQIEVDRIKAEKWDGVLPRTVVGGSNSMMLQLPTN